MSNKTYKKVAQYSLILDYSFYSSLSYLLALFFYSITCYQYDAPTNSGLVEVFFFSRDNFLHVLVQTLPNPFFIYNFINLSILSYIVMFVIRMN